MLVVAMLIKGVSLTDGAQISRVPIPLSDDPYRAVRQSHLVDTDTKSRPLDDLKETEIPQPLPSVLSLVPPSDDLYLIVRQTHTPATIDIESEPEEAPSKIEEFEASEPSDTRITSPHSTAPSDSTTMLSSDHPLAQTSLSLTQASYYRSIARMAVRTQSTLSPGMLARIAKATDLSPSSFCKRYRSSYETPSPSSSPILPIRKRYRGTSELVEDTKDESSDSDTKREGSEDEDLGSEDGGHSLEDECPGSEEEEEVAPEGQQQAVPVMDTTANEPLGLDYGVLRRRELALGEGSVPSTFEIGQSSMSMSEQQRVKETSTPRPGVRDTWVDPADDTVYTDISVDVPPVRVSVQTPPLPEWSSSSLPVSQSSLAVPTPVASPVTTPATSIVVGEDEFLEVGAQLELHGSIIHDYTQRLDALPPTLFEGYDRDLRELYTSRVRCRRIALITHNANMAFVLRSTKDVLPWLGNANMAFDLRTTEDVLPWPGNANMAFDLWPTKEVLLWPGNANMAFDLRLTKDVLSWPGNANMAFDLVPDLQCLLRTWCQYGIRLSIGLATPLTYFLYPEILT
ncbi:hypothetical protein Tco_1506847 [Tanacetum coccineum]